MHVLYCNEHPEYAVYDAGQRSDSVYGSDPYFWRVYRMFCGSVPDPDGGSHADDRVCGNVPDPAADRRKSDLPESGGKFCRAPVNLGAGGGDHRRESDGYRGNADLHPHRVSGVYPVPCQCI